MAKKKFNKVLTCGCEVTNIEKAFSNYNHNKDCTCESLNSKGKVTKRSYGQVSIYRK